MRRVGHPHILGLISPGDYGSVDVDLDPPKSPLFSPVFSANTECEEEGRSLSIPRPRLTVPVTVDESDIVSRYQQVPDILQGLLFGSAPAGDADAHPTSVLRGEICAMRRVVAS